MNRQWKSGLTPASALLLLTGVLLTWLGSVAVAKWYGGGVVALPLNDGLGFVLAGGGLWLLSSRYRDWAVLCGAVLLALGAAGLMKFTFGVPANIDTLFYRAPLEEGLQEMIRTSPAGAFSFLLAGLAIVVGRQRLRGNLQIQLGLGAVLTALGMVATLGHLIELPGTYQVGTFAPLRVHGAVGFTFLGIGVLALGWISGREQNRERLFRLLPMPAGAFMVVGTLILWSALSGQEQERFNTGMDRNTARVGKRVLDRIHFQFVPVIRVADEWRNKGRPSRKEFVERTERALRRYLSLERIEWVKEAGLIVWSTENGRAGERIGEASRKTLSRAKSIRRPALSLSETDSKDLYHLHIPLFTGKWFDGYVVGTFDANELHRAVVQSSALPGYVFSLSRGGEEVAVFHKNLAVTQVERSFPDSLWGFNWAVRVWPTRKELRNQRSFLAEAVLGMGLFLALLLVLVAWFGESATLHAWEVERVNLDLAESEASLRRQAAQLADLRSAAEEAIRYKADFVEGMVHEMRQVLNELEDLVDRMGGTKLSASQKGYVKAVYGWAEGLRMLLDDVLDFSRSEEGRFRLENVEFDLNELVEESRELVGQVAKQRKIRMDASVAGGIPTLLRGDPARLRQVLSYLLNQAILSIPSGRVSIVVSQAERVANHVGLRFEVTARTETRKRKAAGPREEVADLPGAGFSIARVLVEMMLGEFGVYRQDGATTFWFSAFPERRRARSERLASNIIAPSALEELRQLDDDSSGDFLSELIAKFEKDSPEFIGRMEDAITRQNWVELSEEAGTLGAECDHLGALQMAETCRELAALDGPRPHSKARLLVKRLRSDFERARTLLRQEKEFRPRRGRAA